MRQIHGNIKWYISTGENAVVEGEVEEGKLYTESDFNRNIVIKEREAFR